MICDRYGINLKTGETLNISFSAGHKINVFLFTDSNATPGTASSSSITVNGKVCGKVSSSSSFSYKADINRRVYIYVGKKGVYSDSFTTTYELRTQLVAAPIPVYPDLTISAIKSSASAITASQSVKISFTIKNIGKAVAGSSTAYVYNGSTKIGSVAVATLAAGKSKAYSYTVASKYLASGKNTLKIVADGANKVKESNEKNNSKTCSLTVKAADLTVSSLKSSASTVNPGSNVKLTFTIKNGGSLTAGASTAYVYNGTKKIGTVAVAALAAGKSKAYSYTVASKYLAAGKNTLKIVADGANKVKESNESNNSKTCSVTVNAPDLKVVSLTPSASTIKSDRSVKLSFTVKNAGKITAKASRAYVYDGSKKLGSVVVAALAAGKSKAYSYTIAAGKFSVGSHTLKVVADGAGTIVESNEKNNSCSAKISVTRPDDQVKLFSAGKLVKYGSSFNNQKIAGGSVNSMDVNSGGKIFGTSIQSGGTVYVNKGGVASKSTICEDGRLCVESGGKAYNTDVLSGTRYWGRLAVYSGGSAVNVNATGGTAHFVGRGSQISVTSGGAAFVCDGGTIDNTTASRDGCVYVMSAGKATNTTLFAGGEMFVRYSSSVASNTNVSGGELSVSSGGIVSATNVYSGGSASISSGGTADGTKITSGGSMCVLSGGTIRGKLYVESGAVISTSTGAIIDFTVATQSAPATALINDWSLISGGANATYTITVKANQSSGTYCLAGGATGFNKTITVKNTSGSTLGTLGVDEFKSFNGNGYTISVNNGKLVLTIGDASQINMKMMSSKNIIDGTDDALTGTSENDVFASGNNNDAIKCNGGDDVVCFGSNWGSDTVEQLDDDEVTLWFKSGSASNWNESERTYTSGSNSVKVSGNAEVNLKFGDDGSTLYDQLVAAGAFTTSDSKIIGTYNKGILASV